MLRLGSVLLTLRCWWIEFQIQKRLVVDVQCLSCRLWFRNELLVNLDWGIMRLAILDDYNNASDCGKHSYLLFLSTVVIQTQPAAVDFTQLEPSVKATVFRDHVSDIDTLTARLKEFEIVCAMRERTAFSEVVLDRLPNLQLRESIPAGTHMFLSHRLDEK